MRKPIIAITAAAFASGALGLSLLTQAQGPQSKPAAAATQSTQPGEGMSDLQKTSYALGHTIGGEVANNIKALEGMQVQIDREQFIAGLRSAMGDGEARLSEAQLRETMMAFSMQMQQKQQEQMQHMQAEAETNKAAGAAFLAENRKKEGVQVTESGLQYKIIEQGEGASPKMGDFVTVHYRLTLPSGEELQNSRDMGEPARFQVGGVIAGWNEALQMMKPGAKWQLFIPGDLAYGPQGRPGIPPNAVLVFDVELLSVEPAPQQPGQM